MSTFTPRLANTLKAVGIFSLFLLIALIVTWPLLPNLTTEYAGGRSDLRVHQWTFWWVRQALLTGQNPYFTDLLYYPDGVSLTSHGFAWVSIGIWLILQTILGEIAAYNITAVLVMTLNGFCMFLLARQQTRSWWGGFIAGVIFAAWPYTISHYDHPNLTMLFWLPLALLALQQLVQQQALRWAAATAVCLTLTGFNSWHILLMSLPLLALWLLHLLWHHPEKRNGRLLGQLLLTGLFTAVLMAPFVLPVITDLLTNENPSAVVFVEPDGGRTDLLTYFVPPNLYDATLGQAVTNPNYKRPYEFIGASTHYVPFLGYLTLLLVGLGLIKYWRQSRFWLFVAVIYVVLALGSQLALNGQVILGWLPYQLISDTFIGTIIRRPHRLNFLLALPVSMITAWGMMVLLPIKLKQRRPVRLLAVAIVLLATAVILFESHRAIPYTTTPYAVPDWYANLAQDPDMYGVLDLPTHDRRFDKWYMSYQMTHHKPLAIGHVSRLPAEAQHFLQSVPFLHTFLAHEDRLDDAIPDISHQLQQLAQANIRYLVIHKAFIHEGYSQQWRDWLTVEPIYEDEDLIVYETAVQHGRDYTISQPLTPTLGLIRAHTSPALVVQNGLLKIDTRWGSTTVPQPAWQLCFDLQSSTTNQTIPLTCQPVSTDWPLENWGANEVVKINTHLLIGQEITPDYYTVHLQLADELGQRKGESANIGQVEIAPFTAKAATTVVWQNSLQLTGFTANFDTETLLLDLYFQANEPTDQSAVIFIHVLDADTGQLVAQSDAVPHNWQYPTLAWAAGEAVLERRTLLLADLPAGRYDLMLGMVDQETGERVTAVSNNTPSDAIYLTTIQK